MSSLLLQVCAVLYALVALFGLVQLVRPWSGGHRAVLAALSLSLLAHAVAIGIRAGELSSFPIAGLSDGLSLLGFSAALVAVVISWNGRVPQVAVFTSLLAAVVVGVASVVYAPEDLPEKFRSTLLPVHIAFAFLGLAVFAVAGAVSVVFLMQESRLKRKVFDPKRSKLPPLDVLDTVSVRLFQFGFPLLGIGLVLGAVYSKQSTGQYWNWNIINTLGVLVWLLYAVLLYFRLTIGWRGRKAALLTLGGVVTLLVALFVLGLLGTGPHWIGDALKGTGSTRPEVSGQPVP